MQKIVICNIIPVFSGGEESLRVFLNLNLTPYAKGMNNTKVEFAIDTLGQVKNVCIVSDIIRQELSENEKRIIDIIKSMPKWTPGFSGNKKAPVHYGIPIKVKY